MEFPTLKHTVIEHAGLHNARVVLVEDKASGTQLIQQLRSEGMHTIAEAPKLDGDKVMRLRAQTAKFSGGFVLLPRQAKWLAEYVSELVGFPNSKHDDQVDSTVFALAWATESYKPPLYTKEAIEGLERLVAGLSAPWWMR
jgi:predicted phage terminase large subunit-like protein